MFYVTVKYCQWRLKITLRLLIDSDDQGYRVKVVFNYGIETVLFLVQNWYSIRRRLPKSISIEKNVFLWFTVQPHYSLFFILCFFFFIMKRYPSAFILMSWLTVQWKRHIVSKKFDLILVCLILIIFLSWIKNKLPIVMVGGIFVDFLSSIFC